LQPAQLEALQEVHADDSERVLPSPARERPEKLEKSISSSNPPQSGQAILSWDPE